MGEHTGGELTSIVTSAFCELVKENSSPGVLQGFAHVVNEKACEFFKEHIIFFEGRVAAHLGRTQKEARTRVERKWGQKRYEPPCDLEEVDQLYTSTSLGAIPGLIKFSLPSPQSAQILSKTQSDPMIEPFDQSSEESSNNSCNGWQPAKPYKRKDT